MNIDIRRKALVIGATGLLGYGVTHELDKTGWKVRAIGKENIVSSYVFPNSVEYRCGDFYDETFLLYSIKDIDKVFFSVLYIPVYKHRFSGT